MTIYKCKMCGGSLEINAEETVATCEYCGARQTLPKLADERKANLFDRASHFRRNNDFDKAMGIYEQILNEDTTDAESYWSIVLCRYGVEYVEDPKTKKRVPTVNRAQFTSVFDDEDYKSAIRNADTLQKSIYEEEAAAINEIQKEILAISQKEDPFDIFICYKETDNNGRRTQDSVLATELYHELTKEGFKVFFSRITLEDKLGVAYEPYIFAALNSAKVMVAIGTQKENFNAVWVRNEWSRYLSLIKNGASKVLIPAYRDMDPYDLPEEFSHLQAQDMAKLGFMQDLVRGIKKIAAVPEAPVSKETVVVQAGAAANAEPLLKRAFMFLEDGEWESADEYCEKVLDMDPENGGAYLGKLMVCLKSKKQEDLRYAKQPFDENPNYKKILRFGDKELAETLKRYIEEINERNENERLEGEYTRAGELLNGPRNSQDCIDAAKIFESIAEYKNSKQLAEKARERAEELRKDAIYNEAIQKLDGAVDKQDCIVAAEIFESIAEYKDSKQLAEKAREKIEELRKDAIYNGAIQKLDRATKIQDCNAAAEIFESIAEYKDSKKWIERASEKAEALEKDPIYSKAIRLMRESSISYVEEAIKLFESIPDWKDSEQNIAKCKSKIEKIKGYLEEEKREAQARIKKIAIGGAIAAAVVAVIMVICLVAPVIAKANKYNRAMKLINEKNYVEAYFLLDGMNYKDSREKMIEICGEYAPLISVGDKYTVGLKADGTVATVGYSTSGACDVSDWRKIVDISVGNDYTVGLKKDGTVVAAGSNDYGRCDVSDWRKIVDISAGFRHTVGLKSDGTVVATKYTGDMKEYFGQCNVSDWRDIVAVSAGGSHTVGLKADGTVVAVGNNYYGQCLVSSWRDIVAISAGNDYTVGLKKDGTVVAVGSNLGGRCNVSGWRDIVAVSAGDYYTVGLKKDGTVVVAGDTSGDLYDTSDWRDIKPAKK